MKLPVKFYDHLVFVDLSVKWIEDFQEKAIMAGIFFQKMANRLIMGCLRYDKGKPSIKARYLTRLKAELVEYERTGVSEHLVNIANYAMLENEKPENEKYYECNSNYSVTRDGLRMKL